MNPHFVMSSVVYPRLTAQMTLAPALSALVLGLSASVWPALTAARRSAAESYEDVAMTAAAELDSVPKRFGAGETAVEALRGSHPPDRARSDGGRSGAERLRQDDASQHHRRARGAGRRERLC